MTIVRNIVVASIPLWASLLLAQAAHAQPQKAPSMKQLGIVGAGATKGAREAAAQADQADLLSRFLESLTEQLTDAFQNTHKFAVIARTDLKHLLEEQRIPVGGIIDASDPKASNPGKVKGVDYLLVATADDFTYSIIGTHVESLGMVVQKRYARVSLVLKLYNSSTGRLLQSVSLPVERDLKQNDRTSAGDFTGTPKARDDGIVIALAAEAAQRAALRVVDVVFPAKILSVTDDIATISRGEGAGIAPDEIWEVFALGEDLKDPDTGESLGCEEIKVGEIVILDVLPKFSKARIRGENRGIDAGAIVRLKTPAPPPARSAKN